MAYDANGSLETVDSTQVAFTCTPDNMLKTPTVSGGMATAFAYDADQWRVKKAVTGGDTTYYIRGANREFLSEWVVSGATTTVRDYIHAGSRLITVAVSERATP